MKPPRITDRRYRKFRAGILLRDGGRCRYGYPGCTVVATQVDHLVPRHPFGGGPAGGLYDEGNCFSVCHSCHREKERRERAGVDVVGVFLRGELPGDAPVSAHIYGKTRRDRRKLLLSEDYRRRPPDGHEPRRCEECETEYRPRFSWQRYCAKRCRKRAEWRRAYTPRSERRSLTCEVCGTTFIGIRARFCSRACWMRSYRARGLDTWLARRASRVA